jgi:radical SAM superfamily enzyme YgiQ (UPF0313 family)
MTGNKTKKNSRMRSKLDCLFVYVGRSGDSEYDLLLMPIGFLALADFLVQNGISAKVLNFYLQKIKDPNFSLDNILRSLRPKVICFSMHWHPQMHDTIEVIKKVKKDFPAIAVVVGGFSSSYFYKEIMRREKDIDFLIRGDGEIPLLLLVGDLVGKKRIDHIAIPNLCWRQNGAVAINPHSYVVTPKIFNSLRYANFKLLYDTSASLRGMWGWKKGETFDGQNKKANIFYYSPARGCTFACSFCGGGREAQRVMNRRHKTIVKSHGSAMVDLTMAHKGGAEALYICADPLLAAEYYEKLFHDIKKQGLVFTAFFEHFSLPSLRFIRSFRRTFKKDSVLILSPETGSEYIRRKNKGIYYSNAALLECMRQCADVGVAVELYFTSGLPFETKKYFFETISFIRDLRKKFTFKLYAFPLHIEPLSPLFLCSQKYGIISEKRTYKDFINKRFDLGYKTKYFSKDQILRNIGLLQRL